MTLLTAGSLLALGLGSLCQAQDSAEALTQAILQEWTKISDSEAQAVATRIWVEVTAVSPLPEARREALQRVLTQIRHAPKLFPSEERYRISDGTNLVEIPTEFHHRLYSLTEQIIRDELTRVRYHSQVPPAHFEMIRAQLDQLTRTYVSALTRRLPESPDRQALFKDLESIAAGFKRAATGPYSWYESPLNEADLQDAIDRLVRAAESVNPDDVKAPKNQAATLDLFGDSPGIKGLTSDQRKEYDRILLQLYDVPVAFNSAGLKLLRDRKELVAQVRRLRNNRRSEAAARIESERDKYIDEVTQRQDLLPKSPRPLTIPEAPAPMVKTEPRTDPRRTQADGANSLAFKWLILAILLGTMGATCILWVHGRSKERERTGS